MGSEGIWFDFQLIDLGLADEGFSEVERQPVAGYALERKPITSLGNIFRTTF